MHDPLAEYVRQCRELGYTDQRIRETLIGMGHDETTVDRIMSEVGIVVTEQVDNGAESMFYEGALATGAMYLFERIGPYLERLNPITLRWLESCARSRRFHAMITILPFLVIISVIGVRFLFSSSTFYQMGPIFASGTWSMVHLFILIIVPAYAFNAITGERSGNTLDQLIISPLLPREIILGNVAFGLAISTYLMITMLPILSFAYVLGGVPFSNILSSAGSTLVSAYFYATLGVVISSLMSKAWKAAVATLIALVVFYVILNIPVTAIAMGVYYMGGGPLAMAGRPYAPDSTASFATLGVVVALMVLAALLPGKRRSLEIVIVALLVMLMVVSLFINVIPGYPMIGAGIQGMLSVPVLFYLGLAVHGLIHRGRELFPFTLLLFILTQEATSTIIILLSMSLYLGLSELALSVGIRKLVSRHLAFMGD